MRRQHEWTPAEEHRVLRGHGVFRVSCLGPFIRCCFLGHLTAYPFSTSDTHTCHMPRPRNARERLTTFSPTIGFVRIFVHVCFIPFHSTPPSPRPAPAAGPAGHPAVDLARVVPWHGRDGGAVLRVPVSGSPHNNPDSSCAVYPCCTY